MPDTTTAAELPARTHAQAQALLRRPFAPGAVGFRAMHKLPLAGQPSGGAKIAAYIAAQSVTQRLNVVVPGRWRQDFYPVENPAPATKLYLGCRLTITLPISEGGPDVEAVFEDIGELDAGARGGLKALYSDARKRAGAAAGIGTYLYTALEPAVLPIGDGERQVQAIASHDGGYDQLVLSAATEDWLRDQYAQRVSSEAIRRDLGEILAHGEPENGMGQGESAEAPLIEPAEEPAADPPAAAVTEAAPPPVPATEKAAVVTVDFDAINGSAA